MRLRGKAMRKSKKKCKKNGGIINATRRYRFNFWKIEAEKTSDNASA